MHAPLCRLLPVLALLGAVAIAESTVRSTDFTALPALGLVFSHGVRVVLGS